MKAELLKSGLKALYYSGTHRLLEPYTRGLGVVFMLHRVDPAPVPAFAPNAILAVRPDFLDAVIGQVRASGLDIVTLDEARARLRAGDPEQRFACFTLDDGYKDNLTHALPIFAKHEAPFTVYVPSDYPQGRGTLWWLALERVIAQHNKIELEIDGAWQTFDTDEVECKNAAFERLYWRLRAMDEDRQRELVRDLCERYGVDSGALTRELIMSWDEVRTLADHPLATIGAHTAGHYALAKLDAERARAEMAQGVARIEAETGTRPLHLSYPYGDAGSAGPRDFALAEELGFATAVTTRKGMLFAEHANHLTALPRVSLNGAYQSLLYTRLYLTGAPFALWNRFRRVDAA